MSEGKRVSGSYDILADILRATRSADDPAPAPGVEAGADSWQLPGESADSASTEWTEEAEKWEDEEEEWDDDNEEWDDDDEEWDDEEDEEDDWEEEDEEWGEEDEYFNDEEEDDEE